MQYSKNKIAKISRKVPSLSPWDMKVESEFTSSSEIDELIWTLLIYLSVYGFLFRMVVLLIIV